MVDQKSHFWTQDISLLSLMKEYFFTLQSQDGCLLDQLVDIYIYTYKWIFQCRICLPEGFAILNLQTIINRIAILIIGINPSMDPNLEVQFQL